MAFSPADIKRAKKTPAVVLASRVDVTLVGKNGKRIWRECAILDKKFNGKYFLLTNSEGDQEVVSADQLKKTVKAERPPIILRNDTNANPSQYHITIDTRNRILAIGCQYHSFHEWARRNFIDEIIGGYQSLLDDESRELYRSELKALVAYLVTTFPRKDESAADIAAKIADINAPTISVSSTSRKWDGVWYDGHEDDDF